MPPFAVLTPTNSNETMPLPRRPQHLQLAGARGPPCAPGGRDPDPDLVAQLRFMREQEATHYRASDDLPTLRSWSTVTPSDRGTMLAWSYDIVDACSVSREAAVIGAQYFDRFLSSPSPRSQAALVSRREFQLAFVACLTIALKCRAGMQVDADFVSDAVCQGLYGVDEVVAMEVDVLGALGWRLNGPSPHDFIGGLLELLPSSSSSSNLKEVKEQLGAAARVRCEAAALDYEVALRTPSETAYAALLTASKDVSMAAFGPLDRLAWMRDVAQATGLQADDDALCLVPDSPPRGLSSPTRSPPARRTSGSGDVDEHLMCTPPVARPQGPYGDGYPLHAAPAGGGLYCGPVSSSNSSASLSTQAEEADGEPLCREVGYDYRRAGSDPSPTCAAPDGRLDVQCQLSMLLLRSRSAQGRRLD